MSRKDQRDFSQGSVFANIVRLAVPMTMAQLINVLYNIVDRMYIGRIPRYGTLSLTGLGVCFPLITIVIAFANLIGMGGAPLFSIERGRGNEEEAALIMGNSFSMLLFLGAVLTILGLAFKTPLLWLFGASRQTLPYADSYITIYLLGSTFVLISLGLNSFINAQGFPRTGMLSVVLGAVINIILDPIFIFALHMGVSGAALATVISQALSAAWVLRFLFGKDAVIPLAWEDVRISRSIAAEITKLGLASFIMQATNCAVQVACNSTLQQYGGDLYVGVMTVANSIREVFMLPVSGLIGGAQPVMSFNYGAGSYDRTRQAIRFNTLAGISYTMFAWLLVYLFPRQWIGIFSDDAALIDTGISLLRIYFFGFVFMSLQFAGQSAFQSLGDARHAIFFSILRKIIIVVPLTLLLPAIGFGMKGVFMAEPVSNVIGGTACYLTMRYTILRRLDRQAES